MNTKDFIIFWILTQYSSLVLSECETTLEDVDKCAVKSSMFGDPDMAIPTNMEEMDQTCGIYVVNGLCCGKYIDKCLTGLIKQSMTVAYNSAKRHVHKICNGSVAEDKQEFLSHLQCIKKDYKGMLTCSQKNVAMMARIKHFNFEDKLPAFCCVMNLLRDCMRNVLQKICSIDDLEYWRDVFNDLTEDSMSENCANYDNMAKCQKTVNPEVWQSLKEIVDSNDPKVLVTKFSSAFATTIDNFNDFNN